MTIDPSPDENGWDSYLDQLKAKWMEKIGSISPWISQYFPEFEAQYSFRMRYRNNLLRVWFTKEDLQGPSGHPLAEAVIAKDKWFVPVVAQVLLAGVVQEGPMPNPEIEGGQIVLIAQNNNIVQRPPQTLNTMHASLSKRIAFNRRILKVEDEISGINSDLAQFVQGLSPAQAIPIYICVNDGNSMRGSQPIGGQYRRQGNL
jgi:hypothetical protein